MSAQELLKAAHLITVKAEGSFDVRNGLVLCGNHHDALDAGLFGIEPENLTVVPTAQYGLDALMITRPSIDHLRHTPDRQALGWRWEQIRGQASEEPN